MNDDLNGIDRQRAESRRVTIAQTAVLMAILTLVSKVFGFARELFFAGYYGTSDIADAYGMARGIPGILTGGFISGIGIAYTPLYSGLVENGDQTGGKRLTDSIITLEALMSLVCIVLGAIFSRQLVWLFAPRFDAPKAELTSIYLKLLFSYILFQGITGILEAHLRYHGKFLQPIIAGYLFSLGEIAVILISVYTHHYVLGLMAVVGCFLQMAGMSVFAGRAGYHFRPKRMSREAFHQILAFALPTYLGVGVSQINALVDRSLASGLSGGSVSALNYGHLLSNMILTLTVSIITAIFYPKITKAASQNDWELYNDLSQKSSAVELAVIIPLCFGAIVFSGQIVQVVYERGAFDIRSTLMTADAFRFYSIGLIFSAISEFLHYVVISLKEVKVSVACGIVGVACNIFLNLALVGSMQHKGLALATSLATAVNVTLLTFFMRKRHEHIRVFPPAGKIARICSAAAVSVALAYLSYRLLELVWMPRMVYLGLAVVIAAGAYLALLKLLKIEEIDALMAMLQQSGK